MTALANWTTDPTTSDLYLDVLGELKDRDTFLALMGESSTTTPVSNLPTGTKRWNGGSNTWEKWSGSAWVAMTSLYEINVKRLNGKESTDFILATDKGAANGVASLNSSGRLPSSQVGDVDFGNATGAPVLRIKRLTAALLSSFSGAQGELVMNTNANRPVLMTGSLAGGLPLALLTDLTNPTLTTLTVSGNGTIDGTFRAGNNTTGLFVNGSEMSYGQTTAENAEGFNRVFDILGGGTAKLTLRTVAGIYGGLFANDSTYYTTAGLRLGTRSNHPLALMANGFTGLVVTTEGKLIIGDSSVNPTIDGSLQTDMKGVTRIQRLILQDNPLVANSPCYLMFGLNQAHYLAVDKVNGIADFVNFADLRVGGVSLTRYRARCGDSLASYCFSLYRGGGNPTPVLTNIGSKLIAGVSFNVPNGRDVNLVISFTNAVTDWSKCYVRISFPGWEAFAANLVTVGGFGGGGGVTATPIGGAVGVSWATPNFTLPYTGATDPDTGKSTFVLTTATAGSSFTLMEKEADHITIRVRANYSDYIDLSRVLFEVIYLGD